MKNILVVVDSINQEDSSGSKCNVALLTNLVKAGYNVKVYHHSRKDIFIENVECVSIKVNKFYYLYIIGGFLRFIARNFKIETTPFIEKRLGFSLAFFSDVYDITKALKKDNTNPDLVLTLSKAASFRPHKALLAITKWHHKWLAYMHDPYPFHFYPVPYHFICSGHKQKEKFLLNIANTAAYSGFPSLLLKEWMGKFAPNFLQTGVVMPHQLVEIENKNFKTPDFFNTNSFSLLHAGALLGHRNPIGLFKGFLQFLEKNPTAKPEAQLILIGGNAENNEELFNKYVAHNQNIVVINHKLPFETVYQLQYLTAVNIILETKSDSSPFLPGKFPHCVAANKKMLVLGPKNSETMRLLGESYEYWAEVDDVELIACLIEKLYFQWKENPTNLLLNRSELLEYLGPINLKNTINALK